MKTKSIDIRIQTRYNMDNLIRKRLWQQINYSPTMLGAFLYPDVCKDRKIAIALTVLFALLADIQEVIILSHYGIF